LSKQSVAIVTDSTADLPPQLAASRSITVVPLTLNFEGKTLLDGVDIQPDEFYRRLPSAATHPTTSQPSPGRFAQTYSALLADHEAIVSNFARLIPRAEAERVPNVITFFGNRRGMSDREAMDNCVDGLNRVKGMAEDHGVTICVELLNSKIDHKDYRGDHTAFGVDVMKAVASPRVKLLYDIYHMQIMEGDVIRTIRTNRDFIAHFHTGGVPGRHELDETQEVNWRAVCRGIAPSELLIM